jgi:hypothetical protein
MRSVNGDDQMLTGCHYFVSRGDSGQTTLNPKTLVTVARSRVLDLIRGRQSDTFNDSWRLFLLTYEVS